MFRVSADPAIRQFLHRVLDYLSGGSPFAGLVTIHRPLTGIERCVFIIGVVTEAVVNSDVIRFSLQRSESGVRDRIGTQMRREAAACVCPRTNALFVSGIGLGYNEIWQWTGVGGWNRSVDSVCRVTVYVYLCMYVCDTVCICVCVYSLRLCIMCICL